jgi:S-DNA-T family DNA segregation ATPase FtsK/SpoIIIE
MLTLRYGLPFVAQSVLLVAMVVERRWFFVIMMAPGSIGTLTSWMLAAHHRKQTQAFSVQSQRNTSGKQSTSWVFPHIESSNIERLVGLEHANLTTTWQTIVHWWLETNDAATLSQAAVGMRAEGLWLIDLERQGPHALVAGTTGSGKSVLLQCWCMSLALHHSPERLRFVFLDFKGGSAFKAFESLPHTIGSVCDLDLQHAIRALLALERELTRREQLTANASVSDIRDIPAPPPSLIIVIDEFNALKNQLPDYIGRLVRIASLGRSLNMHVIACTQHPLGQVSADMKANMNLNICLRVRDGMQSTELLGDARAAAISPQLPGAAYCNDTDALSAVRCANIENIAALMHAVEYARRFCDIPVSPRLFTAPLPKNVTLSDLDGAYTGESRSASAYGNGDNDRAMPCGILQCGSCIGLRDTGTNVQPSILALDNGNIAIIGTYGRGKTNLLRLLAYRFRRAHMSQRLQTQAGLTIASYSLPEPSLKKPSATAATAASTADLSIWLVDDADMLFKPLNTHPLSMTFRAALADKNITVIFSVSTSRHIRIPEHCSTRIVFPTGERAVDLVNGIPGHMLSQLGIEDYRAAGRAVLIHQGDASLIQSCLVDDS